MVISDLRGENMPHGHEELASNCHNRLTFPNRVRKPLKLGFPVRMMLDCHPGGFNHGRAQLTTPLLGNPSGLVGLPRGMDACTQATVADQLLGRGKTCNVSN